MKKTLLLAAVGMTGLLASCGTTDVVASKGGYYGSYNTAATATLSKLADYTTSYTYDGNYVICKNYPTTVNFNLKWSGYLRSVGFQLKGYNTGDYVNTGSYSVNSSAGSAPVAITIDSGFAPLNIKPQSILINPTFLGYTYIRAQGVDGNGYNTNIVTTDYSIPVMNCS